MTRPATGPYQVRLDAARAALTAGHRGPLPVDYADQLRAAARETRGTLDRLHQALRSESARYHNSRVRTRASEARELEVAARLLAAFTAEARRVCPHLRRGGPQPAHLRLALHDLVCARCVGTRRNPPPDETDRCDWCGARRVEVFTPITLAHGPLLAIGDACGDCAEALINQEDRADAP